MNDHIHDWRRLPPGDPIRVLNGIDCARAVEICTTCGALLVTPIVMLPTITQTVRFAWGPS